jgi:hypothetical protein
MSSGSPIFATTRSFTCRPVPKWNELSDAAWALGRPIGRRATAWDVAKQLGASSLLPGKDPS